MIKLKNISKKFGNFTALDEVSFSIQKGKITALLGPNGAGKTTSMKILTGFLEPTSGTIEIGDEILNDKSASKIQKQIGYLPENAPLYPELNVWEHLDFTAKIHGIPEDERPKKISRAAKMCGLTEKLYFDISELSKGYKQRVGLAQAIIHDPKILILDEPTTGLDPNQILEIRNLILSWKSEKTILLSTHIMQEVEAIADNVVLIDRGKVIRETEKSNLEKEDSENIEPVFIISIQISGTNTELQKAKQICEAMDFVNKIEHSGKKILAHATEDCRAHLAREIINAELNLMELMLEKASMESIFHKLTKK